MYELIKRDGMAKRGRLTTVHGTIETPVFMNVGTAAAIKGGASTDDLRQIKTQVELSNTYHLHVRPGDEVVKKLGGLHKFMNWDRPILTDSGGFQVFSLASLRKIKEEGVHFNSHIDGRKIFMGPEQSMQIQSNLASTIAMAFDECPSSVADKKYMANSVARTTRWLKRCKDEMARLNALPDTINPQQMLFGINQGGVYEDIRIEHAQAIAEMDLDGYAVGGLAVGESHEEMYRIIFQMLFWLGCRVGELLALTSQDIDFENGTVNISKTYYRRNQTDYLTPPKTESSNRKITIPKFLVEERKDFVDRQYELTPEDRIFPITDRAIQKKMKQKTEQVKLKPIRVHDLRHSHIALLIEKGTQPLVIAQRVGHDSVNTTMNIYGHLYPNKQKQVADMLNAEATGEPESNLVDMATEMRFRKAGVWS